MVRLIDETQVFPIFLLGGPEILLLNISKTKNAEEAI